MYDTKYTKEELIEEIKKMILKNAQDRKEMSHEEELLSDALEYLRD